MKFWKDCNGCSGRGDVEPSSSAATIPANMTGEIVDRTRSICKKCHGCGLVCKVKRDTAKISRDEWSEKHDQRGFVKTDIDNLQVP